MGSGGWVPRVMGWLGAPEMVVAAAALVAAKLAEVLEVAGLAAGTTSVAAIVAPHTSRDDEGWPARVPVDQRTAQYRTSSHRSSQSSKWTLEPMAQTCHSTSLRCSRMGCQAVPSHLAPQLMCRPAGMAHTRSQRRRMPAGRPGPHRRGDTARSRQTARWVAGQTTLGAAAALTESVVAAAGVAAQASVAVAPTAETRAEATEARASAAVRGHWSVRTGRTQIRCAHWPGR